MARAHLFVGLAVLSLASPVSAQVALNVNQTHTLSWDWESGGSPVREFLFQCGTEMRRVTDDVRSLRFGSLVDTPGHYTGCTLSAKNEAGLSAPVLLPDFEYSYSYWTLGKFLVELAGILVAVSGIAAFGIRRVVKGLARPSTPLTLPEPIIILQKERDYVHHDS